jgi:hypothetical protein
LEKEVNRDSKGTHHHQTLEMLVLATKRKSKNIHAGSRCYESKIKCNPGLSLLAMAMFSKYGIDDEAFTALIDDYKLAFGDLVITPDRVENLTQVGITVLDGEKSVIRKRAVDLAPSIVAVRSTRKGGHYLFLPEGASFTWRSGSL